MSNEDRFRKIHSILLKDWDPLIINGYGPPDEYDSYIPGIVHMLENNCTVEELERHLAWIEKERMGVSEVSEGISQAAKKLLACWNA
jgi:hypothetical protein